MKFLRVDMTAKKVKTEQVPPIYRGLGGRGLTSILINEEVPAGCDPLGPKNKLVFAPGLLTGTSLANTSRISIGAKSPLTGGIKESNVGGTVPAALGRLGITAVVVEGQAAEGERYILRIDAQGEARLEAADELKGLRTYALVERLFESHGEKNGVLCIGPAGEFRMASASIQSSDADGRPCRAAGRGGLGAVMGAKGLKALVVDLTGRSPDALADPEAFKEHAKAFAETLRKNPFTGQMIPSLGTAGLVSAVNSLGAFPSYNATQGTLEGWEKVSGETLAQVIQDRGGKTTHMGCTQCIIHCSNDFVDEKGAFVTSSLEYETIWSMGGMTGITDLDAIAKLDRLADDIGLDTMNTGVALAVAMDAGYKPFGDVAAALEMMEEIGQGTEMGRVLGEGPAAVGKHFNHPRVPVVKNQSIAAYDPRGMQGNGVTYATSPMGADHTAGNLVGHYLGGALDPLAPEGQVEASRNAQIAMAALDCTGVCLLAGTVLGNPKVLESFLKVMAAKTGEPMDANGWAEMGRRVLKAERTFNRNAGFTPEDDRLPAFFRQEALPPHNKTFLVPDEELDQVFDF